MKIDFYFDFLSPFSFFAWLNHKEKLKEFDLSFNYRPILMGRLFSHHNFPGPGEIEAKRDYELKKCFRYAAKQNIQFSPPSSFPFNPLGIIRLATIEASSSDQIKVIDTVFRAIWQKGMVLEDPELVAKLFSQNDLSEEIIEKSFARESKKELKANIKSAIDAGLFGVPSFVINNEFFWGNDSFDDILAVLRGNDSWNKDLYNKVLANNKMSIENEHQTN